MDATTTRPAKPMGGKFLAWVQPHGTDEFLGALISERAVPGCPPATHRHATDAEARKWIEGLAASVGFEVAWVNGAAQP